MGALTILNERGDQTIAWSEDRDADMEAIIEKKMREGVSFFIIDPRLGTRRKLQEVGEASRHRLLAIPDEDFAKFVGEGSGELVKTPSAPARNARKSKNAKEIAKSESVAVRPARGG
ncbi:MAG: hypothetical protein ACM31O_03465 [Bacteroidota bacterium]